MMQKRFPLVIDYDDNNRIIELPAGNSLNLENSDICNVGNISITGGILTIDGEKIRAFSGEYKDLIDAPFIPETLVDLGIVDGAYDQVLHTDGNGNFVFRDVIFDYDKLSGLPQIPTSILDLNINDGASGSLLSARGDGTFEFINLAGSLLGTLSLDGNTITSINSDPIEINPVYPGYITLGGSGLVLPQGITDERPPPTTIGAVRFNTETNQFEGQYSASIWGSLGGVKSVDGDTYITAEQFHGSGDNTLTFVTGTTPRFVINDTSATFDVPVSVDTLSVNNLDLHDTLSLKGNIEIGDEPSDTLTIQSRIVNNLVPKYDNAYDLGTKDLRWRDFWIEGHAHINNYMLPSEDGEYNQVLKTDGRGILEFTNPDTWGGNRVYVSQKYGSDYNDGVTVPVKTIKRALEIASGMVNIPTNKDAALDNELNAVWKAQVSNKVVANSTMDTFDIGLFEKDYDKVFDAIVYDMALATNYNQTVTGSALVRRNDAFVKNNSTVQEDTLDYLIQSISELAITNAEKSSLSSAVNEIKDIVLNGTASADVASYTVSQELPTPNSEDGYLHLLANKTFLSNEIDAYYASLNGGLVYSKPSFRNNIEKYIDAVAYHVLYGGNNIALDELSVHIELLTGNVGTVTPALIEAYEYFNVIISEVLKNEYATPTVGNATLPDTTITSVTDAEINKIKRLFNYVIEAVDTGLPITRAKKTYPTIGWISNNKKDAIKTLKENKDRIFINLVKSISKDNSYYDPYQYRRDIEYVIHSLTYDFVYSGNSRLVQLCKYFSNHKFNKANFDADLTVLRTELTDIFTGARLSHYVAGIDTLKGVMTGTPLPAMMASNPSLKRRIGVIVATGDYNEMNPIVIPDFVSIIGEAGVTLRPVNADKDIFRVRNNTNIINITFKDHVDAGDTPDYTWRYAAAIDNPEDYTVDVTGMADLDRSKVTMFTPFTIQNCNAISVLGGSGVEVDGRLVNVLEVPPMGLSDEMPETGYAALLNGLTVTSFGGNAIRVTNDARVQAVGCTTAFNEVAFLTQSGGLLNTSNSSSSYGYFNLRSSGKTPVLVDSDVGLVTDYGEYRGLQMIKVNGLKRPAIEHYVMEFNDVAGDVTNDYRSNAFEGVETGFTPNNTSVLGSVIEFSAPHNFTTGDRVEYDSNNDFEIIGLKNGLTYYVYAPNATSISLYHDEARKLQLNHLDAKFCTDTHYFRANYEEIFINEILSEHNVYQDITLPSGHTYIIVEGNTIYGTDGTNPITATVANWDETTNILTVGIELSQVGTELVRNKFTVGASVDTGILAAGTVVNVLTVSDRDDLFSSEFTINTSRNEKIRAIENTMTKGIKLYRPSICNATGHVWNFPGSGVDYEALPQHGGLIDRKFETVDTLPGRVYAQGTNEAGDFRIGKLIEAYQKAGRIDFNSKLRVQGLEILSFADANSTPVQFISADPELGDTEFGGASDDRLVTQKATRTFLDRHLSTFYDKRISALPEPSAVVQLNSRGQLNEELLAAKSTYTAHIVPKYNGRFDVHNDVPAKDLLAGDIVIEEYDEVVLTLSSLITVSKGDVITQPTTGARGVVKEDYTNDNRIRLLEPFGVFDTVITNGLAVNGTPLTDAISSGVVYNVQVYGPSQRRDNYFINTAKATQYLVLEDTKPHNFVTKIGFAQNIYGATSKAVAVPTSHVEGALVGIDLTNLPAGDGYTDGYYKNVQLRTIASTGTDALAHVTVAGGKITEIDIHRTGSGYTTTSTLIVAEDSSEVSITGASFVPRVGGTQATLNVNRIEERLYVEIDQSVGLNFYASDNNLDFITDDASDINTINTLEEVSEYEFLGYTYNDTDGGVDTSTNTITFTNNHTLSNGDYVIYDSNGYPSLGGMVNGRTYYVEVIDDTTVKLFYTYGMHPSEVVNITKTERGNQYLRRPVVNTLTNQFYLPSHGYSTGDPIQFWASNAPGNVVDGDFFFVGAVTPHTFSVHYARTTALDSVNGTIIASHDITSSGTGSANLHTQSVAIRDVVNTSGALDSSWTTLMKTEIDGEDVITGTIDPHRLGVGVPTDERFVRGDSSWQYAVQSIKTTNDTSEVVITGPDHSIGPDKVWHGDVNVHVNYASYDDPAAPNLGEETAGIAAFHFDHFEITSGQGLVTTKPSVSGGEIDAKYLDGEDGDYWRDPTNHNRPVPVEWGGTNQSEYTTGDILYAATDLADGTYTQVLERLPIGSANAMLMSNGTTPMWTSTASLSGLSAASLQLGITTPTTVDTAPGSGNLTLGSDSGEVIIDARIDVQDHADFSGDLNVVGDTVSLGSATYKDIKISVDFDNMISTQTFDLRIKPVTGETSIESNVVITGDTQIDKNLTVNFNSTFNQNVTIGSDLVVHDTVTVDDNATINDVQIGVSENNEIDTKFGNLVLDSFTGLTIIDDNLRVVGSIDFDGDIIVEGDNTQTGNNVHVGDTHQTGNTHIDGEFSVTGIGRFDEVTIGKDVDNEISTVSTDLLLDSFTGTTIVDDKLIVQDETTLNADVLVNADVTHFGDTNQTGTNDITGTLSVSGNVQVDDITIGAANLNEISTASMDLILNSATGTTIVDDKLDVEDDVTIKANATFYGDTTTFGDTVHQGDSAHTGIANVFGDVNVDGEVRIDDIKIGMSQTFEIEAINGQELWLDSDAGLTVIDDDLRITGDLTVLGATTSISSTSLIVSDKNIVLADGSGTAMDANGAGITVDVGTNAPVVATPTILYNAVDDSWDFNKNVNVNGFSFNSTNPNNMLTGITSDTITVDTLNILSSSNTTGDISATGIIQAGSAITTPGTISATGPGYITSVMGFTTVGTISANGTITSASGFVGNADTASKWLTPRTVFFQTDDLGNVSDVVGQFTIDGSGDVEDVVLSLREESVQDYVGALIATNGTHTGITTDYQDLGESNSGALNFALDEPYVWDFVGHMFTANTETGIVSSYNAANRKIDFAVDYQDVRDSVAGMLTEHTNHDGVTVNYDPNTTHLTLNVVVDTLTETVGDWIKDSIGKGIDITYDAVNNQVTYDVHDPVITLAGDISGSATMTDLGDVTINTTMIAKAVDLGTNTTGDYVQSLIQGDGILIENPTGEGSTPRIGHANTSSATNVNLSVQNSSGPEYGGGVLEFDYVSFMTIDTFGHFAEVQVNTLRMFQGWDLEVNTASGVVAGTPSITDHIYENTIKVNAGNKTSISYDASTKTFQWDTVDTYVDEATWDAVSGDVTIVQKEDVSTDGTNTVTNTLPNVTLSIPETLDTLTSRGNVTTNAITVGNITNNGTLTTSGLATFGNVDIGAANTDTVTIAAQVDSNIIPNADITYDLGSAALQWNRVFAKEVVATGPVDITNNVTITGTVDIDSQTTVASLNVEDLTATRVVFAGTNGELVDDADMTFAGDTLSVTNIDVNTQATMASANVEDLTATRVVYVGTGGELVDSGNMVFDGTTLTAHTGVISNNLTVNGLHTATDLTVTNNTQFGSDNTKNVSFVAKVSSNILPATHDTYDLGAGPNKWRGIYASSGYFDGDITNYADTSRYNFSGGYLEGSTSSTVLAFGTTTLNITGNTIAPGADNTYNLGTSSNKWNTVYATTFNGVATQAYYADLAEKYQADKDYACGTLVMIGGKKEVTAAKGKATTKVIGIVSTNPAHLMNAGQVDGTEIALVGRVPCLVKGKVKKGDYIVTSKIPGIGMASKKYIPGAVVGKALHSDKHKKIKYILVAVGV